MAIPSFPGATFNKLDTLSSQFNNFTASTSSSCDVFGSIGTMVGEITQTVYDAFGNAVGTVRKAAAEVFGELKDKLADCFGGSGDILNKMKGYVADAQSFMAQIGDKFNTMSAALQAEVQSIMTWVGSTVQSVSDLISSAIDSTISTFNDIKESAFEVISGMKIATCSTLNTVLAGTPDDAFDNITGGATGSVLGSVKDSFNTGADSLKDITTKVADRVNMGGKVDGAQNAAKAMKTNIAGATTTVAGMGTRITRLGEIAAMVA